ncbi:MAG: glycosyl hydrolase family 5, partial [Prevotella sp.]|nr:glycosyl hydrolase family 5 [Prevotella sp.]
GQKVAAGSAASGPRIFQFSQGGYLPTGLYIRQSDASKTAYAEVGTTSGYGLSLKKGNYNLSYYAIGWAGNPYVKCEVFDENNNCLGSQIIRCNNNVGKSLNTNTYGASYGVVNFYANHTGYYHFRWTPVADAYGNSGTWLEVVFGHIKIQQGSASAKSMTVGFNDGTTTAIDNAVESGEKQDVWFNLQGQRVAKPSRGIYIHNGKKVICR